MRTFALVGTASSIGIRPGYFIEGDEASVTTATSLVVGRGRRESYGEPIGPFWTVFWHYLDEHHVPSRT